MTSFENSDKYVSYPVEVNEKKTVQLEPFQSIPTENSQHSNQGVNYKSDKQLLVYNNSKFLEKSNSTVTAIDDIPQLQKLEISDGIPDPIIAINTTDNGDSGSIDNLAAENTFIEVLCNKMDTFNEASTDPALMKNSSTDDSTDFDVSYSDSSPPVESDHGIGSSTVIDQSRQSIDSKLEHEIERLNWRIMELEKEASHEVCQTRVNGMERSIEQLKLEIELSRQEHSLTTRQFAINKLEYEKQIEHLKRECDSANKEKEAAVVRYAVGEMEVITQKKEREGFEKKLKECNKEKEVLINKIKVLTSEKIELVKYSIISIAAITERCTELSTAQKEVEHMKDEMTNRDIKLKWVQNKLKSETEGRKEAEEKLDEINAKVQSSLQEAEKAKQDALETIRQFQDSEENKAFTLGQKLKEEQVQLMLVQHEKEDRERTIQHLHSELQVCRAELQSTVDENTSLSVKIQQLEKERLEYEQNINQLKRLTDSQSQIIVELQASVQEMESLRARLQCEQERLASNQSEMERLRQSNSDLIQDMESCRKREEDMLEFTQKLTAKNVRLQSEFTVVEARAQQLEFEKDPMQKQVDELQAKVSALSKELSEEKTERAEESKVLARHVAEKTTRVKTLESQIDDLTNEAQIVKRKNAATLRELNRELAQLRKRAVELPVDSGSGSPTSSCTSLNEHPSSTPNNISLQMNSNSQMLIERIAKLQRENAKAMEKIDFLEEHTRTLVEELQKKSRVLQSYILREEAGALSSRSMDLNKTVLKGWSKLKTKAELSKHGGIMASVYGSKSLDEHMTLELSLEINRKLQAVLEDTLLKNITLKENIDTLGDEIARLSHSKRLQS
ncbi:coiled-coil domain-containing protein 186 [Nilaparvata lugens]|uniref:coiled-coil domain-containing protein 186 n=1 Tax=Nilaparvata lugens TaxID=108931 RepID=UPI00193E24A7|nr:coiled-coil domain-containing protein 186 [Nilaparvata lugens]